MDIFQWHNIVILQLLTLNFYESATAIRGPFGTAVNYVDASDKRYNFVVSIDRIVDEDLVCTGSLFTKRHVLSALHCLNGEKKEDFRVTVRFGDYGHAYEIKDAKSFLQWVAETNTQGTFGGPQDIAVYTLMKDVKLNDDINFLPLTEKPKEYFYGKTATILGWGETDEDEETAELQIAQLRILTPAQCEANIKMFFNQVLKLRPERFCSNSTLRVQLGTGDSGGPLIYENEIIGTAEGTHPPLKGISYHPKEQNYHMVLEKHHRDFVNSFRQLCH